MNKTAPELKENLLSIFGEWITPHLASYEEPARAGTPKGDPIGLSKKKFYAANLNILSDAFTLKELAKEAGVSHDQFRKWRTEAQFFHISINAFKDFATFIINKFDKADDPIEYRKLLNCLLYREDLYIIYSKEMYERYLTRNNGPIMEGLINLIKLLHLHGFRTEKLSKKKIDKFDAELARIALEWIYNNLIQYLPVNEESRFIFPLLCKIFTKTV